MDTFFFANQQQVGIVAPPSWEQFAAGVNALEDSTTLAKLRSHILANEQSNAAWWPYRKFVEQRMKDLGISF